MTVASLITAKQYTSNGSTTQYAFPNKIFSASDLVVTLIDLLGNQYSFVNFSNAGTGLSYSVQGVDVDTGCTVVFSGVQTNGWTVDIRTLTADTQSTSIKNQGQFLPELHEEAFDRATRQVQDLLRLTYTYGIHGQDIETTPWPALPAASVRAGFSLVFDTNGLPALGTAASAGTITGAIIANLLNLITTTAPTADRVRTAAEISAGVIPTNYTYSPGDSRRYNFDLTGVTNNTALLQAVFNAAGIGAATTGLVNEVTLYPGTYLVNRLYLNYSNVLLKIMPGAVIKLTQTGITNNNTTGQSPAYAIIHVNPLTYLNNPSSAVTAISNVRIYGGGTVQGPYSTTHAYDGFTLGIVSNDCNKCVVDGVTVQGCGGENILLNPSAWNTCTGLRILNSEILQGGEVGINNARDFAILNNYVHDSWSQNGIGGDGDNGIVGWNRVRNMAGGALTPGGSGAKDILTSREILYIGNTSTATGQSIAGTYAFFCSDDGAITIPKYNHRYIGNTFDAHNGPIGIGCDYNTALNICIENNTVTSLVFGGGSGADFAVVAGSGNYYLRGNNFNPGLTGNAGYGVTNSSAGTPAINIEEGNDISGHATADINWSAGINLKGEFVINSLILVLTGFAAGLNVPIAVVKKGSVMEINFTGTAGTSNATTMTLGTLPVYLRPTRTQNFRFPVIDNGTNLDGLLQIAATGVMTLFKDINGAAFTNIGTKGLVGPYNITCLLT